MPSRTRPPARRSWSLAPRFGASRPRINRGFGALSASARTRFFTGTGEAAARMPGGAPMIAPETGRRRTLRHRLARAGSAPHQPRPAQAPAEATAFKLARALADPSLLKDDAAPLSNASGSAPRGRDGRRSRTLFRSCQGLFSEKMIVRSSPAGSPSPWKSRQRLSGTFRPSGPYPDPGSRCARPG